MGIVSGVRVVVVLVLYCVVLYRSVEYCGMYIYMY